ncbi:hypothetical protein RHS01_04685 [Rhizoctonia solani]|uniref:Uncharacterized protein n=1 Tax=Rhizoctonia solani TaxID=456999 RepID=A0A8H7IDI8_9AGAM|nr:hypothetical protein RHS01_04685 [Rhizoctonia solani]
MSDPSHPIFKQFTELDPSLIVIRDAPHPDWVWSQPPALGTLTPGYTHCAPGTLSYAALVNLCPMTPMDLKREHGTTMATRLSWSMG